jgi:hypothetical protein
MLLCDRQRHAKKSPSGQRAAAKKNRRGAYAQVPQPPLLIHFDDRFSILPRSLINLHCRPCLKSSLAYYQDEVTEPRETHKDKTQVTQCPRIHPTLLEGKPPLMEVKLEARLLCLATPSMSSSTSSLGTLYLILVAGSWRGAVCSCMQHHCRMAMDTGRIGLEDVQLVLLCWILRA